MKLKWRLGILVLKCNLNYCSSVFIDCDLCIVECGFVVDLFGGGFVQWMLLVLFVVDYLGYVEVVGEYVEVCCLEGWVQWYLD